MIKLAQNLNLEQIWTNFVPTEIRQNFMQRIKNLKNLVGEIF